MRKFLFLLMMTLSIITLTTSCGDDNDDSSTVQTTSKIVGVWRDIDTSDGNEDWTFNADGTGNIHFDDINVNGHTQIDFKYEFTGSQVKFMMTIDGNEVSEYSDVTFSEDGTTMTLGNDGDPIILKKIK